MSRCFSRKEHLSRAIFFPTTGYGAKRNKEKGDQESHLCGINHCMLRESEAETEACGRWSSSVVFVGGIWRKTVPPSSACGETNGRMIPHCGASTATTAASTPFPSLPRPAGCEIDKDREAAAGPSFCQGYERIVRAQHARWGGDVVRPVARGLVFAVAGTPCT